MKDSMEKARERRAHLAGEGTDAYRVVDGVGDGVEGLIIDDFAGHWLVQTRAREFPVGLAEACEGMCRSVWWKVLDQEERGAPEWVRGERVEGRFPVRENGCIFLVDFGAGYSQGLFLDQRLNRAEVRRRSEGVGEVLNCFSYTCGFAVAAGLGGARTTSVDLSAGSLEWGKRNMEVNGLEAGAHEFCRGDAREWLKRFTRKGRRFGGVILDPPTFSRNQKGKVFRVEKDYGELVARAAAVVKGGGWMLCSTNCRALEREALERMIREGLREGGAGRHEIEWRPMPPEYRGENYLKSYWIEFA